MKNKFLLSTLLGSALLVGCTADDALETNKVTQNVNPAAPVFTVSFDNDDMRAVMGTTNITWEEGDKMSLYHGGGKYTNGVLGKIVSATDPEDNTFYDTGIFAYTRNAIYESKAGAQGEKNEFSTHSMVLPGAAIMIYPADLTMLERTTQNPIIKLEVEQTKNTKNNTPYVSEVLEITDANDLYETDDKGELKNPHSAGYGKEYDIRMRRIGSLLRLSMDVTGADEIKEIGVPGIEFTKVAMSVDAGTDGTAAPFTKELEIKIGKERGQTNDDGTTTATEVGTNTKDHKFWKWSPWIEPRGEASSTQYKSAAISTVDIDTLNNKPNAYFTLLLPEDRDGSVLSETETISTPKETILKAFKKPTFTDATIKVYTTYGTVELKEDADTEDKDGLWMTSAGTQLTLTNGLAQFLSFAFMNYTKEDNPLYENQLYIGNGTRTISVDLSDLDMDGLHIKTAAQLVNALKVYNTLKKDKEGVVTFILDGDPANGDRFVMDKAAWEAVADQLTKNTEKKGVQFAACANDGEKCAIVVLDNTAPDAVEEEVPSLKFTAGVQTDEENSAKTSGNVKLELKGEWSFEGAENKVVNNVNPSKNFDKVTTLTVKEGAILTLKAIEGAQDGKGYVDAVSGLVSGGIVVEHGATLNVAGHIYVARPLTNYGEINVPAGTSLRVYKSGNRVGVITNESAQAEDANGFTASDGVMNVGGTIGIVESSGSDTKIKNYGLINQQGSNATIYVSENETQENAVATLFNNGYNVEGSNVRNKIGTIKLDQTLTTANNDVTVEDGDKQGFIRVDITATTPTAANFGTKANYAKISGCESLAATVLKDSKIKYIEFSTNGKVRLSGDFTTSAATGTGAGAKSLTAMIVRGNSIVHLNDDAYLKVDEYIYAHEAGATVEYPNGHLLGNYAVAGYFGGETKDADNLIQTK